MTRRRILLLSLIPAVVAALAFYYAVDPAQSGLAPRCVINALTGYLCPGCGSQRMLHALLHGDLASAWHHNAFLLCFLPLLAVMAFSSATRIRHPRLYMALNSIPMIIFISAAITVWTVARNLF